MSSWGRRSCLALSLTTLLAATAIPAVAAESLPDQLVKQVGSAGINRHLIALQRIADTNGHTRAASTPGHAASAEYIAGKLEAAGYDVTRQEFPFVYTQTLAQKLTVNGTDVPIIVMTYSPSTPEGGITAPLAVIPVDDTPGCEKSDFGDVTGKIVLVRRGGCTFAQKQQSAADAGAVGAVIYNNADGDLNGTLGDPSAARIPTGGITKAAGADLATRAGAQVTLELRQLRESRTSYNVVAETKTGRKDNVVMAGAHVDSVPAGPGINDDGSGSATLLEIALRLGGSPKVANAVRFGFWSAEELGLIGSTYYVDSLSFDQQLDIALYLNFDMIASPNAGYFVYDGDDSDHTGAGPGPYGSTQIEQTFTGYLNGHGVATEGTDFDGRSDYGEFIAVGIPSGGLFTGAEGIKTADQATKWGGKAGTAYDPCYHQLCDNLGNLDYVALDRNADAAAYAIGTYALSTQSINGVTSTGPAKKPARLHTQAVKAG
ncbi:M28 family metallopeptidase [Amycolatopsis pigmentata]|uniref:M28 family metallopeptidase n=1 Tax=Amycolatopsis pigmentata TaxID=450801 RepID=A0ABW5FVH5_9PSEU